MSTCFIEGIYKVYHNRNGIAYPKQGIEHTQAQIHSGGVDRLSPELKNIAGVCGQCGSI